MTQTQAPETQRIDPLLHDFEMPLQATYYPLGFPLHIATNCSDILLAAEESWGRFREMHAVPAAHQLIHQVRADEARAARHQITHSEPCLRFTFCRGTIRLRKPERLRMNHHYSAEMGAR